MKEYGALEMSMALVESAYYWLLLFSLLAEGPLVEGQVPQMNDKCACWEAVHGKLTQKWKCWHQEVVESQQCDSAGTASK